MQLSQQHVRGERDKTADGISPSNGQRAPKSSAATRLFQSEFEAHHEVDPCLGLLPQGVDDRLTFFLGQTIRLEDLRNLRSFRLRDRSNLLLLPCQLLLIVFRVALGCKKAAEA